MHACDKGEPSDACDVGKPSDAGLSERTGHLRQCGLRSLCRCPLVRDGVQGGSCQVEQDGCTRRVQGWRPARNCWRSPTRLNSMQTDMVHKVAREPM